jgi:calcineurin-like phosphoesterase family protein
MGLDPAYWKLQTPGGWLFAEPDAGPNEAAFQVDNTSQAYYDSVYYKRHSNDLQPIPRRTRAAASIDLADVLGDDFLAPTIAARKLSFHAVGDTGAAKVNVHQTAAKAIANEASVADSMSRDVRVGGMTGPAFFFHLGDVVYNFGEGQYYYDQFYEPFRAYDRPIFAVPGNHDGMVFGDKPDLPQVKTLTAFVRNFCARKPAPSPDSGGLVRTTMIQPGVYFTLDAPFVSIVGLYTNVLEGPGVISSQGGHYEVLKGDAQLEFLRSELKRLAPARKAGERAVIIACHHPPVSVDAKHGGTTGLADDIDTAAREAGFWPDAVLSGHAHLYQRYTRKVDGREIPYVVAGSGGFSATPPRSTVTAPFTFGEYTLVKDPVVDFGYLTVTVDMSKSTSYLTIEFNDRTNTRIHDTLRLNLKTGRVLKT